MRVLGLQQPKDLADGQRQSESGSPASLSFLEEGSRSSSPTALKPGVHAVFRLMSMLTQSSSVEEMLYASARLITQLIGHARALLTGCLRSRETPGVQPVSGDGVIGVDGGSDAGDDRDGGSGKDTDT